MCIHVHTWKSEVNLRCCPTRTTNLFFFNLKFHFMCMGVVPACMSVHFVHAWCPQRSEEVVESPGTRVNRWLSTIVWVLGIEPKPSENS